MQIERLIRLLSEHGLFVSGVENGLEINGITYDSRLCGPGSLFVCKGAAFLPKYLDNAVAAGACCYLSDKMYDVPVPGIIVNDIRRAMSLAGAAFYDFPDDKLDILAITGTKGKTTTSYIARSILDAAGMHYGLLSSVMTDTGLNCCEAHLTTPESLDLQSMLNEMVTASLPGCIMEVSSQGLQYDRVYGLDFAGAAFLNIGQDHISPIEHSSFEEYFAAKKKIFSHTGHAFINADDPHSPEMLAAARAAACEIVTFGFTPDCDVRAYNVESTPKNSVFRVRSPWFDRKFTLPLLGAFNIYNALAAISMCASRVSAECLQKGVRKVRVPGRMEVIADPSLTVIVDYAHNKMSFETLFSSLREEFPGKRIVSIYGCPGGKAFLRRKDLGETTARLADYTLLTAEDPNYESVEAINDEIARYIIDAGGACESVPDRERAIEKAIMGASDGDIIVITGKGEETFQKVNGEYTDFSGDIPLSKKYLKKRKGFIGG